MKYRFRHILPAVLAAIAFVSGAPAVAQLPEDGGWAQPAFGFKGGFALAQHQGTEPRDLEYEVSSSLRRDVAIGVFMELPVTRRFSLQQEVLYVSKGSRQDIGVDVFDVPTVLAVSYDMDYLEIPVLLRYGWVIERAVDLYSLAGFAFGIKLHDRYQLTGLVDDGTETIPLSADSDMSEVDLFDFAFTYGFGAEIPTRAGRMLLEYRFDLSLEALPLPTYADVPFGDETVRVDNDPVPLRNQTHMLLVGIRF